MPRERAALEPLLPESTSITRRKNLSPVFGAILRTVGARFAEVRSALKDLGKKIAVKILGILGAVASFIIKTAGQVLNFWGKILAFDFIFGAC